MKVFFKFFAERHLLAMLVTLMTIMLGLSALTHIKRDIWPEVNYGIVIITTRYPGASPEDVELNVTNKLEGELRGVTGIERFSSISMENISVITIFLDPDVKDQNPIKRDIEDAVSRVTEFPPEVTDSPLITDVKTSIYPVLEVGMAGDLPYRELRELARRLEDKLEAVPGVSSVSKHGYLAREIKVEVSPTAIRDYQVPLREIIAAIQTRNIRATAGSFESYTSEKNVVTLAQFRDPLHVRNVIVRSTFDGPLLRVKDLAVVRDDFEDAKVLSRLNGKPAISFMINKKKNADVIRTVAAVRELADKVSETLPEGVELVYSNDFSKYVSNRFEVVRANLGIGLLLVIAMLSIFLNLRGAFWVAMGIPISLLGVIYMMPLFDLYLDSISLAAMVIVLGIIVDDGIIIAENVQRHWERGETPLVAAVEGIREVFPPVLTTVLTTFLAFAPMFFMSGILGSFVFVIPMVISLALFISLIEATVALPAHLTMGLRHVPAGTAKRSRKSWFLGLSELWRRFSVHVVSFRYLVVAVFVAMLAVSLWYATNHMKFQLFPSSMAQQFNILIDLPIGSSLQATSDKVTKVEELVANLPEDELESYVTRIGTQEVFKAAGYPPGENENTAFVTVHLSPFNERSRTADEIVESLREQTNMLSGFERIRYAVEAGGPPVGKPVTIRLVGSDDTLRARLADSVAAYLAASEGVKDVDRDDKIGKEQIELKINYNKLARLGLTVADVAQNVRIAYDGEVVTSVRYGDEDVDFRVQLQEQARRRTKFLAELPIPNRQGRLIPLEEIAWLHVSRGPSNYFHFDEKRAITITADIIKGRTTPLEVSNNVLARFDVEKDWPGMRMLVGGEAEETRESMDSLFRAFLLAVIGIYFLLILLFNSTFQPFMVMSAIPFGLMGVIAAFVLHDETMGFVAMMGVIGLAGVLVNDALVLVNHINRLKRHNPEKTTKALVAQGSADRLRAVVLTSLTTVVGLLPLAYGIGGSDPYMAPMALALGYGILFATPVTMILVPCLYMISHDLRRLFVKREKGGMERHLVPDPADDAAVLPELSEEGQLAASD